MVCTCCVVLTKQRLALFTLSIAYYDDWIFSCAPGVRSEVLYFGKKQKYKILTARAIKPVATGIGSQFFLLYVLEGLGATSNSRRWVEIPTRRTMPHIIVHAVLCYIVQTDRYEIECLGSDIDQHHPKLVYFSPNKSDL